MIPLKSFQLAFTKPDILSHFYLDVLLSANIGALKLVEFFLFF